MDPTQFIAALNRGKPAPAYFLRGPDRFLHEECRRAIIAVLPAGGREWCFTEIEFKSGRLARELEGADQMPMLGSHSYFFFSDPEDFKQARDEDCEDLEAYLESPSPTATVAFAAVEPDRRRRFIQLLEKKTQVVEMLPLAGREAGAWLKSYLRQAGIEIDPQLAETVAAKFETRGGRETTRPGVNLLWMRTEIDKLLAAKPEAKRLDRGDLDLIVTFREEHEIGKLLGALAERHFGEALAFLRALLASKEPETLLVWCIGDLFRQAIKGAPVYPRGSWSRPGSPFSTYEIAQRAARSYSRDELRLALRLVRSADLAIKSSWKDSAILLEFLMWQIITARSAHAAPAFELPDQGLGQVGRW